MKYGELTLHKKNGEICGKVKVSLKIDIPEEMMQMLVDDISKGVENWAQRIIISKNNGKES